MPNHLFDRLFAPHVGVSKPFLHLLDGGIVTYDQFLQTVASFAQALVQSGLRPGDVLAVQVEKSMQALAVYGACVQAGVVFLPLNTAYTASELVYFVRDSGTKCFWAMGANLMRLGAHLKGLIFVWKA
jgi:malonyl-CoA/methylmalonyl-CoA synthetase